MKIGMLRATNPAYDAPRLEQWEALYHGGKMWDDLVEVWLPQHPEELDRTYAARLKRALYHNNAGPIVDLIVAGLFSQPPEVNDLEETWSADFQKDVDTEGNSLTLWLSQLMQESLIGQRAYCWVNKPAMPEGLELESRADEEAHGLLSVFLVALKAEHVIDWERDDRGRLVWIMVQDCVEERPAIDKPRKRIWRWTYIDGMTIRRWKWEEKENQKTPSDDEEAEEAGSTLHGMGSLPVVELRVPDGLHAMGKMHHPAIAHLRSRNDLSWALHRAAHPLLAVKSKHMIDLPVFGPGRYMRLAQDDDAGFIEPAGSCFQLIADDTDNLREDLYRVVQQMSVGAKSSATSSAMSGESKEQDWRALETVLSALAERLKPFITEVLKLVAVGYGTPNAEPTVSGLEGWHEEDLITWLTAAAASLEASRMSRTFREAVAKRQARLLLGNEPKLLEEIDAEIETAPEDLDPYAPSAPKPHPDQIAQVEADREVAVTEADANRKAAAEQGYANRKTKEKTDAAKRTAKPASGKFGRPKR